MQNIDDLKGILEEYVQNSNQVFITGHIEPDFDSIASSIAMALLIKKYKKPVYIIFDEDKDKIQIGVNTILDEAKYRISFIDLNSYLRLKSNNDLLICLDNNKNYRVCCKDYLNNFNKILIIDHHKEDKDTIDADYKYIYTTLSSTSEVITELLRKSKVRFDSLTATYLLAGIYLDTNNFRQNLNETTFGITNMLYKNGGSVPMVNELFGRDLNKDKKIYNIIDKAYIEACQFAISINDDTIYTKEELAEAANRLLRYKTDSSFVGGKIDETTISISARSKGRIDVSKIMEEFGGGGNEFQAATKIVNKDINTIRDELVKKLKLVYSVPKES